MNLIEGCLFDEYCGVRPTAIKVMAKVSSGNFLSGARHCLQDVSGYVRLAAVKALGMDR